MTKQRTRTKPAAKKTSTRLVEKNVDQPCPTKEVLRSIQYLPENSLTIEQVVEGIRSLMSRCRASEEILYEELLSEADGWKMRLEEVQNDDGIKDEDEDNA